MTFLATLFALLVERYLDWSHLRHWQWFLLYQQGLKKYCARLPATVCLAITLALPLLVVALIQASLTGVFYDIFKLVFATFVLLYCLGPNNFWAMSCAALSCLSNQDGQTRKALEQQWQIDNTDDNTQTFHLKLTGQFLLDYNRRVFAVLFWFAVLGPAGAVLYRMLTLIHAPSTQTASASRLRTLLDWIPVRILSLTFSLAGNFTETIKYWQKNIRLGPQFNDDFLVDCGIAAANVKQQGQVAEDGSAEREVLNLLNRSLVVTLVCLALMVLSF